MHFPWLCDGASIVIAGSKIDFVSAWKAVSVAITGFFGLLALLTESKDEKKHLTNWGRFTFVVIAISTSLGVLAQLVENSKERTKQAEDAATGLRLATNTNATVIDIQRLLAPLELSVVAGDFVVSCNEKRFRTFCDTARQLGTNANNQPQIIDTATHPELWSHWINDQRSIEVSMDFFVRTPDRKILSLETMFNDYKFKSFSVAAVCTADQKNSLKIEYVPMSDDLTFVCYDYNPAISRIDSRVTSAEDVHRATVVLTSSTEVLSNMKPKYIFFQTKQGRAFNAGIFKTVKLGATSGWLAQF